jgi:hypothetical protein
MFMVADVIGPVHLTVALASRVLLEHDCPDPPCHEVLRIPPNTQGQVLRIVAIDRWGHTEQQEFTVVEMTPGAGSAIAAGA